MSQGSSVKESAVYATQSPFCHGRMVRKRASSYFQCLNGRKSPETPVFRVSSVPAAFDKSAFAARRESARPAVRRALPG
jgi:hypothetical protein